MNSPAFVLTMATHERPEVTINTANLTELHLTEKVNDIAKALSIVAFRGNVVFIIYKDGAPLWSTSITFTDDLPNGYWSTSKD